MFWYKNDVRFLSILVNLKKQTHLISTFELVGKEKQLES